MTANFQMPTWSKMATDIAQSYVDCTRHAVQAETAGDIVEAEKLRKMAQRWKRMMDRHGITIRPSPSVSAGS